MDTLFYSFKFNYCDEYAGSRFSHCDYKCTVTISEDTYNALYKKHWSQVPEKQKEQLIKETLVQWLDGFKNDACRRRIRLFAKEAEIKYNTQLFTPLLNYGQHMAIEGMAWIPFCKARIKIYVDSLITQEIGDFTIQYSNRYYSAW